MSDGDWLQSLKVGDEVVVRGGFIRETRNLARVDKATATQIVIGDTRFRRKDGHSVGADAYTRQHLDEATPERKAAVLRELRRRRLLARVAEVEWRKQTDEVLEAVVSILDDAATSCRPHGEVGDADPMNESRSRNT